MKIETFTRTIPWYELRPAARFIYRDKMTKLYFVILSGQTVELQGAGYYIATAYRRLQENCYKLSVWCPPLDEFSYYADLKKEVSYKVRVY